MTKKASKYFDIMAAKKAYASGQNITELLKKQKNISFNTSEIIETAYDFQAGTYIDFIKNNPIQIDAYINEMAQILKFHLRNKDHVLDVGTGELTTLTKVLAKLEEKPSKLLAFDISWSRVFKGLAFAKELLGSESELIEAFVGDIEEIPLHDKSINVTISSHALEPNGAKLKELIQELFRVTADKLVLFEPCYEINSDEGKRRMERLGYIQNLDGVVAELGGKVIEKIQLKNVINKLNPTVCFVIIPPSNSSYFEKGLDREKTKYSVPGTDISLEKIDGFYFSKQTGLCFPILKDVPILKSNCAILASALVD